MIEKQKATLTLMAGGDVGPVIEPVDRLADLVLPVLRQADIRVAQCERTYSERGSFQEWTTVPSGKHSRLHPSMSSVFKTAGFDVVSMASNHALDWGYDALFDTIDLFRNMGMQVIGAGRNAEEARRPAIVEKNGVKVAILGYCSAIRDGFAAGKNKAGIAPMRARTSFDTSYEFQPGSPPIVLSVPIEEDVAAMQQDIAKAKAEADSVVIFIHWGIRAVPKILAAYQPLVAHAAIDAGADLILGHHAHCIKAVEVYKGKVCFYSIGNFLATGGRSTREKSLTDMMRWNVLWLPPVDKDTLYGFPAHCKQTILPKVVFGKQGVERVAFLPAYINKLAQPEVLNSNDPRFGEVVETMEWVSDYVPHKFRVEGNEVVVGS